MKDKKKLTVEVIVDASLDITWKSYIEEESIIHWNYASEDWHCPWAKNSFKIDGKFVYRMEAKNGSFGFDFGGKYLEIEEKKKIVYELDDSRRVELQFIQIGNRIKVVETFEAEEENSLELQKSGWQAILNNFKKYVEHIGPKI